MAAGGATLKERLRQDMHTLLFALAYLVAWGGTFAVLGGLSSLTAYCLDNQPLGLGKGFDLTPPKTAFTAQVIAQQRAMVTTDAGAFSCGRFFRMDWTLWALQLVFLVIVGASWHRRTIHKYQSAHWALGAVISAWHMYKINYICDLDYWTIGLVHTRGLITAGGLIFCCLGNFGMSYAAGPYAEQERAQVAARRSGLDMAPPLSAAKVSAYHEVPVGV